MLDICTTWAKDNGISFAPSKCLILHEVKTRPFKINDGVIPQEEKLQYLGMMLNHNGIIWNESFQDRCESALALARMLKWGGMHINGLRMATSLELYKTFIRPIFEYGLAAGVLNGDVLEMLEKTQRNVLRQIFSVNTYTSIKAQLCLANITTMEFRNFKLHANYFDRAINKGSNTNPITCMIRNCEYDRRYWYGESYRESPTYMGLWSNPMIKDYWDDWTRTYKISKEEQDRWRLKSITDIVGRDGDVASAISVDKGGHANPLLSATFIPRSVVAMLLKWRTGTIAIRQPCVKCGGDVVVTREHAVKCSGLLDVLKDNFSEYITGTREYPTLLDEVLDNMRYSKDEAAKLTFLADGVTWIRINCLGWEFNAKGELRWPTHISLRNRNDTVP